ncbi:MAG: hypothetical protein IID05_02870 [Gemmatimonadetes bacterium]|nr:hypothetical protein [Gemmatimonadota bacterium]
MPIHVSSEIGPLRAVLVHEPGNEVLAVTPGTRRDFLYDDIIELDTARTEHRSMVAVLQRFAEVYEVGDLLRHIAENEDARKLLAAQTEHIADAGNVSKLLADRPADDLVTMLIQGAEDVAGPIARTLNQGGYALPPLPNLFFTRDVGIVIGGHAVIGSMRHEARWSEELLIKALFACHPVLENAGIIYDGSEERRLGYTLEGGDVHPVREDLLIVGFSDRTSAMALDHLCDITMARCGISDVIVVVMPGEPTAVHLDMLFTQIDHGLCVVSPPQFIGPQRLAVLHRRKGKAGVREMPDFFAALKEVDFALEPILCGGSNRALQEREQWASGCNLLALRPGLALAYKRNEATLGELEKAGFRIVGFEDFLSGDDQVNDEERTILTIRGSELVRGGGGPRCMSLPLLRDAL